MSASHVLRSLAATAGAGPFMLINDALDARRQKVAFRQMALMFRAAAPPIAWSLALGIVVLAIASWTIRLLGSGI